MSHSAVSSAPMVAEHRARVTGLERLTQHTVVEGRDAARVLTVDGGEDRLGARVRPETDARDPLVGVHQDDRNGRCGQCRECLASRW